MATGRDVDYNISPPVTFTTSEDQASTEIKSFHGDKLFFFSKQATEPEPGQARQLFEKTQLDGEAGSVPFLMLVIGGCIAGLVLMVALTSIVISIRINFCKKAQDRLLDTKVADLSYRENRVLSLFLKTRK